MIVVVAVGACALLSGVVASLTLVAVSPCAVILLASPTDAEAGYCS